MKDLIIQGGSQAKKKLEKEKKREITDYTINHTIATLRILASLQENYNEITS